MNWLPGRRSLRSLMIAGLCFICLASSCAAKDFRSWTAAVVAGDAESDTGAPTKVFDNARRSLVKALIARGFLRENVLEFSAAPTPKEPQVRSANAHTLETALKEATSRTEDGCLLYFTSHGTWGGMILGGSLLQPKQLARIVKRNCGSRLTVVIVSACFSGAFVPSLKQTAHIVLTASRADRSSFGCGERDVYTYFDSCLLGSLPHAQDFVALGRGARACVSKLERETRAEPASEPQLWVGAAAAGLERLYPMNAAPPGARSP